ncbi:MAG: SIS domain-containing protein [Anaerolineales bacterium]|jgi:glucosamine--fructose-6-phosphate aminotransferase (isomerizing)
MKNDKGFYTHQEILSQPAAWAAGLAIMKEQRQAILDLAPADRFNQIVFTGCGSAYYLALASAALAQELTGLPTRAFPASELWLYPQSSYTQAKTLLVALSRSGETTETLRACQAFQADKRGELLTLSCYGDMPLAKLGTHNIVLPSGQEQSVAQTRAFSTLYLGTVALACLWSGRVDLFDSLGRLPEVGARILTEYASLAAGLGRDASLDRFYWLGSGPRQGLACELSLKMKEMSLTHSEPFHFMEFRHGPKAMVTPQALVVGLRSTHNKATETAVLEDVKALGGRTLDLAEDGAEPLPRGSGQEVRFGSGLDEAVRNVLYLPVGQLIAFERSLSKGLDPDRPGNLDSVVKLQ